MKDNTLILFSALVLLGFSSCASRRSKHSERSEHEQVIHRTVTRTADSQTHRLTIDSHHVSLGYRETATIIPLGSFSYHPDSGFRGRAIQVELRHEGVRTERHLLHDSTQHLYRTTATIVDSAATKKSHAIERREIRHTPWRWVAAVLVLAVFAGFLIRRFFR